MGEDLCLRIVEVEKDGIWTEVNFRDLKIGDKFRMFDPPELSPVKDNEGYTEWFVTTNPAPTKSGAYGVDTEPAI